MKPLLLLFAFLMLVLGTDLLAQPAPSLSDAQQKAWRAVGIVNAANRPVVPTCTGVLVAPDLVLTAAHCSGGQDSDDHLRDFVIGWSAGRHVLRTPVAQVHIHPVYFATTGLRKLSHDIAVLRLERPVPEHIATPVPVLSRPVHDINTFGFVGYRRTNLAGSTGRFDCARSNAPRAFGLTLSCAVVSGNSGAPVLVAEANGWKVAGVLVATLGDDGALAALTDHWLIEKYEQAKKRAASQHRR